MTKGVRQATRRRMLAQSPWALSTLFLLSLSSTLAQSPQTQLSFDTPVTLTGGNFSTTSTPVVFSLPSSSQITISIALCAAASSSPPRVFLTNTSSDSQVVIPGPAGGPNVFEVTFNGLGLGNFTLDLPAGDATAVGVLAVYDGTTTDSLEIGVSQGGERALFGLNKLLTFILVSSPSSSFFPIPPYKRPNRSMHPSRTYPSSPTQLRIRHCSSPRPSSRLGPGPIPNRPTRTTPSRKRTRRPRLRRRPCRTLRSSSLRWTPD